MTNTNKLQIQCTYFVLHAQVAMRKPVHVSLIVANILQRILKQIKAVHVPGCYDQAGESKATIMGRLELLQTKIA